MAAFPIYRSTLSANGLPAGVDLSHFGVVQALFNHVGAGAKFCHGGGC